VCAFSGHVQNFPASFAGKTWAKMTQKPPGPVDQPPSGKNPTRIHKGHVSGAGSDNKSFISRFDLHKNRVIRRTTRLWHLCWASFGLFAATVIISLLVAPFIHDRMVLISSTGGAVGTVFLLLRAVFNATRKSESDSDKLENLRLKLMILDPLNPNLREELQQLLTEAAYAIDIKQYDHFEKLAAGPAEPNQTGVPKSDQPRSLPGPEQKMHPSSDGEEFA
jgi:hypothetical protein